MRLNVRGALLTEGTSIQLIKHVEQIGHSEHEALLPILLGRIKSEIGKPSLYSNDLPVMHTETYYLETEIGEFPLVPNEQGIVFTT